MQLERNNITRLVKRCH